MAYLPEAECARAARTTGLTLRVQCSGDCKSRAEKGGAGSRRAGRQETGRSQFRRGQGEPSWQAPKSHEAPPLEQGLAQVLGHRKDSITALVFAAREPGQPAVH